jgi:hypothetical protein
VLGLLEAIEPGELLSMRAPLLMAFSPEQHRPLYAKNCFERNPGPLPCAAIVQASVAAMNTGTQQLSEGTSSSGNTVEEAEAETFRRVTFCILLCFLPKNENRKPVEINH